jgi:hypothetical protein
MKSKRFIPALEALEDRLVPAVDIWVGGTSANYGTASNWSLNAVPGSGDTIKFGVFGTDGNAGNACTLDADRTVAAIVMQESSVGTDDPYSGTITIGTHTLTVSGGSNTSTIYNAPSVPDGSFTGTGHITFTNVGQTVNDDGGKYNCDVYVTSGAVMNMAKGTRPISQEE